MTIKTDVYIDGTKLPSCSEGGISVTPNKLYASNAGRSPTTGDFIGDVVAIKYDINLTWDMVRESTMNTLSAFADSLTVEHTVKMMFDGKTYTEKQCYIADLSRTIQRQKNDGTLLYKGVTMHIVEI